VVGVFHVFFQSSVTFLKAWLWKWVSFFQFFYRVPLGLVQFISCFWSQSNCVIRKIKFLIFCLMWLQVFLVKICEKMNSYSYYGYQEKNTFTSCEEMRMESVICPKPRRLGLMNHSSINTHIRPFRHPIR